MTRTQNNARRWLVPVAIWAACIGRTTLAQGNNAGDGHLALAPHNEQGRAIDLSGTGVPLLPPPGRLQLPLPCYPNCDQSTTPPILNVNDFACFLNMFAAGDTYANCDQSTTPPVLNVLDFSCFLNRFAAGCP